MNSKLTIGTWKEDVCPEEKINFSVESFGELLEEMNFSEKNNIDKSGINQWCEVYINEIPQVPLDLSLEIQHYYETVL